MRKIVVNSKRISIKTQKPFTLGHILKETNKRIMKGKEKIKNNQERDLKFNQLSTGFYVNSILDKLNKKSFYICLIYTLFSTN